MFFFTSFSSFFTLSLAFDGLNKSTILKNHYYTHNLLKSLLIFTTLSFDMFPNTQKMTPTAPSTLSPGQRESLKIAYLSRFFSSYVKAILPSRPPPYTGTCPPAPLSSSHTRPLSKQRGPEPEFLIPALCQNSEVPSQSCGLAGYIDDLSGAKLQRSTKKFFAGAAPGRVHEEDVEFLFFGGHVFHEAAGVVLVDFHIVSAIKFRVDLGVFHSLGVQQPRRSAPH